MIIAIIAGVALTARPEIATTYIKPFGTIFLNLIKWIVCPLVFFSIMAGVISMRDIKKVGVIGGRTVVNITGDSSCAIVVSAMQRRRESKK